MASENHSWGLNRHFLVASAFLMTSSLVLSPNTASAQANCQQYSGNYNGHPDNTYVGRVCDGEPNGHGKMIWGDGEIYVGQFKEGEYHGLGTRTYEKWGDRSAKYVGLFYDGYEEGQGRLELSDGSWYEGTFEYGDFAAGRGREVDDDEIYEGEFKDEDYHGLGTRTYINWDDKFAKYVGIFEDGYEDGQGRLELSDGSWYEGEFEDGDFVSGNSYVVSEDEITNRNNLSDPEKEQNTLPAPKIDSSVEIKVSDKDVQPLVRIPPIFPSRFLQGDNSGFCEVRFDVSAEGQPFNIQTTLCTSVYLKYATIKSVQKWKYRPKIVGGRPVPMRGVESKVSFHLQDDRGKVLPLPAGY